MTILTSVGLLKGFSFEKIKDKLENELFTIMKTGWKVMHFFCNSGYCVLILIFQIWPWVNLVNFYYVPFLLRPLVINFVAFFWYTYLAWVANGS